MRLCVATCWEEDFLPRLAALAGTNGSVHEVFGAQPRSPTGSGRDAAFVPDVDATAVARHVAQAHAVGLRFNYLLNGSCMAGAEHSRSGHDELVRQIRWLDDIGVDAVTVTIPVLVELIRTVAPRLEIVVSTIAHVDSVAAARAFRDLGASRVTVATAVNRDLPLLRTLAQHGGVNIEVLANELCLHRCPMRGYHYDLMAHGSQPGTPLPPVEYPHLNCSARRMRSPGELLKARFIRPEDVGTYEQTGVALVKLAGRGRDAEQLLGAASAYLRRRHDGNLLDIADLGLWSGAGMAPPRIVIDNRRLDGFLAQVAAIDCGHQCGTTCTVCDRVAKDVVTIADHEAYLAALERARAEMTGPGPDAPPLHTDLHGRRGR